jgi:sugar lactone lactonase YvrE
MTSLEVASDTHDDLGESPRWHVASQTLYWVDVFEKVLHRYTPASNLREDHRLVKPASALAFRQDGGLLLAVSDRIVQSDNVGNFEQTLATATLLPDARFNDSGVDPQGRLWVGAFCNERKQDNGLYRLSSDVPELREMDTGIQTANGISWSPDGKTMYFADSQPRVIYAYDFDGEAGVVTNRRVFVDCSDQPGVPDGITVDAEGHVWCAFWDGWRVVRYNPSGAAVQVLNVPAARVTACAFGGEKLDHLFITCAISGKSADKTGDHATAGRLYVIETKTPGIAPTATTI